MKTSILLLIFVFSVKSSFCQEHILISKELRDKAKIQYSNYSTGENDLGVTEANRAINFQLHEPAQKCFYTLVEEQVGITTYDLQTHGLTQNRIYKFEDKTISTVWTMGNDPVNFPERGTGYNYFNGLEWAPFPENRIESDRTGWPLIAPWGENGEITCAHISGGNNDGLLINRRVEKGAGEWEEILFQGPAGYEMIFWPSMTTSGIDHNTMHLLVLTAPEVFGGIPYQGQNGALLYSRSQDGGTTWDIHHHLFEELDSANYTAIRPDSYLWAESKGETLAFIVADTWMDLILMKSTDNGDTWEKTIIWEHPYPLFDWETTITDTLYCADNSGNIALDENSLAHIVFGISRVGHFETGNSYSFFPYTDGIAYWNETMPAFSNDLNALNPYGHPNSELIENYNLVGWTQDVNGNGEIEFLYDIITYKQLGISTMPQIVLSESNIIYLIFSSTTETFDNGIYNYKHIWARASPDGGTSWGSFFDLITDNSHIYDECIYPAMASFVEDGLIFFTFQFNIDNEPGLGWGCNGHPWCENKIIVADYKIEVGISEKNYKDFFVSQNRPNPAKGITGIYVETLKPGAISIEILDVTGRVIDKTIYEKIKAGKHSFKLNISSLNNGVYFYKVSIEGNSVTKKMIVN